MLYLNDRDVEKCFDGKYIPLLTYLMKTISAKEQGDYCQPIKPYVKFNNKNRIIAMPAYIGGEQNVSGIKWIASYPCNIYKNIPRANSISILNSTITGEPFCFINSTLPSIYRTAAVSGIILKKYLELQKNKKFYSIGILGFGPIGKAHYHMCKTILDRQLKEVFICDRKLNEIPTDAKCIDSIDEIYNKSDILFLTTTSEYYLKRSPKKSAITFNISLRDFDVKYINTKEIKVIVDDWNEVNREGTNIKQLFDLGKLFEKDSITIEKFLKYKKIDPDIGYFFNPMGMAVFDVATAKFIYDIASEKNIGEQLS